MVCMYFTELVEGYEAGSVVMPVDDVVHLDLGGVGAGPPHGEDQGLAPDLAVVVPVECREGLVVSLPLLILATSMIISI